HPRVGALVRDVIQPGCHSVVERRGAESTGRSSAAAEGRSSGRGRSVERWQLKVGRAAAAEFGRAAAAEIGRAPVRARDGARGARAAWLRRNIAATSIGGNRRVLVARQNDLAWQNGFRSCYLPRNENP